MTQTPTRDACLAKVVQLAVSAGRQRQSSATGFVHVGDVIPLTENFLFSLALLRTKMAENVLEAKEILEKLLNFQAPNGNFPEFLHQYPHTKDYFLCVDLLYPIHYILKYFKTVLGTTAKRVEKAQKHIQQYLKNQECRPSFDRHILLEGLSKRVTEQCYESPTLLGKSCLAYQVAGIPIPPMPWDIAACCYNGPAADEKQYGFEPEVTLYDLFMSYRSGVFPKRVLADHLVHLWGALIHAEEPIKNFLSYEYALSTCPIPERDRKWQSRYKRVWGNHQRVHSFVWQGGNVAQWHFDGKDFLIQLDQLDPEPHREELRELTFYLDRQPINFLINGKRATTFRIGDNLVLETEQAIIKMVFNLDSGEGDFMGHLMLGNRPSQISHNPLEAFDWQIILRTIRRSAQCSVRVSLQFFSR